MTAYIAVKTDADGSIEPMSDIKTDEAEARAIADDSLSGEVMRLVPEDFVSGATEESIRRNAEAYNEAIADGASREEARQSLPDLVVMKRRFIDLAEGLFQWEVEKQNSDPNHDPDADTEVWKNGLQAFKRALDKQ